MYPVSTGPPPDLEFGLAAILKHGLQHGHRILYNGNRLIIDAKKQVFAGLDSNFAQSL